LTRGVLQKENFLDKVTKKLHSLLNTDKIPLIILAMKGGKILGAVQLEYREMDIYLGKDMFAWRCVHIPIGSY